MRRGQDDPVGAANVPAGAVAAPIGVAPGAGDPLRKGAGESVEFALDVDAPEPVRTMTFYCRKVQIAGGPLIVMLSTSRDERHPEYPAFFFQGELPGGEGAELAHQTVRGRLFMQQDSRAAVYHTAPGSTATVMFRDIEDDRILGEIPATQLISSDGGRAISVSAEFRASLRSELRRAGRQSTPNAES